MMNAKMLLFFSLLFVSNTAVLSQSLKKQRQQLILMGSGFELTAIASSDSMAYLAIQDGINEIRRIEKLISSWDPNSQTSAINNNAGIKSVTVDKELFELIRRSKKISELTDGAFDPSFASIEQHWEFNKQEQALPDSSILRQAVQMIDWNKIKLDAAKQTVYLEEKGMKIGFGGIGKGYAAMQAKKVMTARPEIKGGVVNASGDLVVWGINSDDNKYRIQIADPEDPKRSIAWLDVQNTSVVTSGDYEKYFTCDGKRYSHIIDPKTGYPTIGIKSVSVICSNAELGDALATSIFVLGIRKGMQLIDELSDIECLIIDDDNNIHSSKSLDLNYYKN